MLSKAFYGTTLENHNTASREESRINWKNGVITINISNTDSVVSHVENYIHE